MGYYYDTLQQTAQMEKSARTNPYLQQWYEYQNVPMEKQAVLGGIVSAGTRLVAGIGAKILPGLVRGAGAAAKGVGTAARTAGTAAANTARAAGTAATNTARTAGKAITKIRPTGSFGNTLNNASNVMDMGSMAMNAIPHSGATNAVQGAAQTANRSYSGYQGYQGYQGYSGYQRARAPQQLGTGQQYNTYSNQYYR